MTISAPFTSKRTLAILSVICLQVFSLDMSYGQDPAPAAAVSKKIMGGDLLRVSVDEASDLDGLYPVAGDGTIDFSYAGRILVEGLAIEDTPAHIEAILEQSLFKQATVHVEVSEYVSGSVLILGAVANPGSVPYKGNEILTLLEAIIGAGGLTSRAASDQVKIFRWKTGGSMEREVLTIDMKKIMSEYDFSRDQYLRPRDIIVVPEMGQEESASEFLALGEFGNPGFHPAVKNMNMIRAITIAGGISREARLESTRILRPGGDGNYSVIPVDLARLLGSADMKMNINIYPGDILFLPSANLASGGTVYFLGEIAQPGVYPLSVSGDSTLVRTILQRGGLSKFSNGSAVKILRKAPDGSQQTVVFDVDRILKSGQFDQDIPLQDQDVIMIPEKIFSF